MLILSIETSCDETALALVEAKGGLRNPQFKIIRQEVASQIKLHRPFGGVVPGLAKREHQKNLPLLLKKVVLEEDIPNIDLIAVTVGPGLEPALWQGVNFAEDISRAWGKPLLGVNHLEGHIYSNWLETKTKPKLPAICLIVSGGHTILTHMTKITDWKILGQTRDDAVGEAFDKVARLLKLPYPGGPEIEAIAKKGKADAIPFPRPMIFERNLDFSFSGLKTAVLYYVRDHKRIKKADVAASFQQAAFDVLIKKSLRAADKYKAKSILLCGGVASSQTLRSLLKKSATTNKLSFHAPGPKFNTDNATMIAVAGYINFLQPKKKKPPLKANGNLSI